MPGKFLLEIITPERAFFTAEVKTLTVNATDGLMAIQSMYNPAVISLTAGITRIDMGDGEIKECATSEGFLEVRPDETILFALTAEWPDEIDIARAEREKLEAEEELRRAKSVEESLQSEMALARAMARLKAGRKKFNI